MKIPKYRYNDATGELYRYSAADDCYRFICDNPLGLSKRQLIKEVEYEEQFEMPCDCKSDDCIRCDCDCHKE